jgi:sugar (pentulose or hexulose) kinase
MKADMLGLPVERPAQPQTASLGAAMLAAVAVGHYASLAEAAQAWYRPAMVFSPDSARFTIYQEVYDRYKHYNQLLYGVGVQPTHNK